MGGVRRVRVVRRREVARVTVRDVDVAGTVPGDPAERSKGCKEDGCHRSADEADQVHQVHPLSDSTRAGTLPPGERATPAPGLVTPIVLRNRLRVYRCTEDFGAYSA
jgi:hypothetical protein